MSAAFNRPTAARVDPQGHDVSGIQKAGVFVLIAFLFIAYSRLTDTLFSNTYLALITSVMALTLSVVTGGLPRSLFSPAGLWLTGFSLWLLIAIPFSFWPGGSVHMLREIWVKSFLAFLVVAGLPRSVRQCRIVLYAIAVATLTIEFRSLLFGIGADERLVLESGILSNPNSLAQFILIGLPFIWLFVMTPRPNLLKYLVVAVGTVCGLVVVGRTGSRGALVAIGASIVTMIVTLQPRNKMKLVAGLLFSLLLVAPFVSSEQRSRYMTMFGDVPEDAARNEESALLSRQQRLALLRQSIDVTIHNPLFGSGPGVYDSYTASLAREEGQRGAWQVTHNTYTQISSEAGIPALVCYLGALLGCIFRMRAIYKNRQPEQPADAANLAYALFLSLVAFAVTAFFDSVAYQMYFPTLAGLCVAVSGSVRAEVAATQAAGGPIPAAVPPVGTRGRVPPRPVVPA